MEGVDAEGAARRDWFLTFHCFTKYIKLTFFRGASLTPPPKESSKYPEVRYFHIYKDKPWDDAQLRARVQQAAALPGEVL